MLIQDQQLAFLSCCHWQLHAAQTVITLKAPESVAPKLLNIKDPCTDTKFTTDPCLSKMTMTKIAIHSVIVLLIDKIIKRNENVPLEPPQGPLEIENRCPK